LKPYWITCGPTSVSGSARPYALSTTGLDAEAWCSGRQRAQEAGHRVLAGDLAGAASLVYTNAIQTPAEFRAEIDRGFALCRRKMVNAEVESLEQSC